MRAQNFKSWLDTGEVRLGPLTGFFGTNSSGKTSLLQLLLMLKQTVESNDQRQVLQLGNENSYVELGTFQDVVHGKSIPGQISFGVTWQPTSMLSDFTGDGHLFSTTDMHLDVVASNTGAGSTVTSFDYSFSNNAGVPKAAEQQYCFGMRLQDRKQDDPVYELTSSGHKLKRGRGRPAKLPSPIKCYGFPNQVYANYRNVEFLSELVISFETVNNQTHYLGPLRDYPHRLYLWGGGEPQDVGKRGENAVAAMLAARSQEGREVSVEERVAYWLKELGLIHDFKLQPVAPGRREYEVVVQRDEQSPFVFLTDVGFGVSQLLPVLVLLYYVPAGSIVILEQPEIHLHPSVQAGLADVLLDAIKTRGIQIILESHSEHLLLRLQRRIAEGAFDSNDAALYFCESEAGASSIKELIINERGKITNWPKNFFGDRMTELAAMTRAGYAKDEDED